MARDGVGDAPVEEPPEFEVARRVEDLDEDTRRHLETLQLGADAPPVRERRRIRIPQLPVLLVLIALTGAAAGKLIFTPSETRAPSAQRLAHVAPPSPAPAAVSEAVAPTDDRKRGRVRGERRQGDGRRHVTIRLGRNARGNVGGEGGTTRTVVVRAASAPASNRDWWRNHETRAKPDPKPEPRPTLPFFHLHNEATGDHYFTISEDEKNEMLGYGYEMFAIEGYVFGNDEGGLTAAVNADNGTAGFVYAKEHKDARPLYYLRSKKYGDFFTSDAALRDAWVKYGWDLHGTVGWIG